VADSARDTSCSDPWRRRSDDEHRTAGAHADVSRVTRGSPQVEAALGRTYLDWGGYEQAVLHLERALDGRPSQTAWATWLDEALVATGAPARSTQKKPRAADSLATAAPTEPTFEVPEAASRPRPLSVGPLTQEPTESDLAALERRASEVRRAVRLTRAGYAVLVAAYGPPVRPWPTARDLPPDVVDHKDAQYVAIALLGRWLRPDLQGLVHPDSLLTRGETAYLLEPQVRRYPDLMKRTRRPGAVNDVAQEDRLYYAASTVAASGLLELTADGRFRPSDPLTGEEAAGVAERLRAAVRAQSSSGGDAGDGAGGLP